MKRALPLMLLSLLALPCPLAGCNKPAPPPEQAPPPQAGSPQGGPRRVDVKVSNLGYTPARIPARPGESLVLVFRYDPSAGACGKEVVVPSGNEVIKRELTADKPVEIALTLPADKKEITFTCGMNMLTGKIVLQ
jgi:plastocyanin domain-containing protein